MHMSSYKALVEKIVRHEEHRYEQNLNALSRWCSMRITSKGIGKQLLTCRTNVTSMKSV